ncbi:MAG: hypothetical protein AMJ46_08430 [Latescibacteria bacterium DG_63]|nr:MAG: hypothetical protein AMJ46_08430 [Latescibacteria bacterium DG_63]
MMDAHARASGKENHEPSSPAINRVNRLLKTLILSTFLVLILVHLVSFWTSDVSRLVTRFADDAYFYFEIARNLMETGRLTFDGQSVTNGFHPLWMALLIPVFALANDPTQVLRIVGSLNVLLLGTAGFLGLRFLATRHSMIALSLSALVMARFIESFIEYCMETSIVVLLCVLLLTRVRRVNICSLTRLRTSQVVGLGWLLAFIQLARLDAIFLNCTLLLTVVIAGYTATERLSFVKGLAVLAAPSLGTGSVYLLANYAAFGHFVPVSAVSKSLSETPFNYVMLRQLLGDPWSMRLTSTFTLFSAMLLVATVYVVAFCLRRRKLICSPNSGEAWGAAVIASSFAIVFTSYFLIFTSWKLWGWYSYPGLLVSMFTLPSLVESVERRVLFSRRLVRFAGIAGIIAGTLAFLAMCVVVPRWGHWTKTDVEANFKYQNYLMAEALNAQPERLATFGMGDRAGSFAYFYKGNVLQLEGLVGDYELVEAIRHNDLMNYMSEFNVEYVNSHVGPAQDYSQWTLLIPSSQFSSGPSAQIVLCKDREVLRKKTPACTIFIWRWPGCDP